MVIKNWFLWRIFHDYFPRTLQFLGSSIPSWRDSLRSTNIFRENEKKMFYLGQVSTGHYEKYFNIFLRSVLVRTPCKPHFCSLHELHVLCISRDKPTTKLTYIERRHRELNPGRIGERPGSGELRNGALQIWKGVVCFSEDITLCINILNSISNPHKHSFFIITNALPVSRDLLHPFLTFYFNPNLHHFIKNL